MKSPAKEVNDIDLKKMTRESEKKMEAKRTLKIVPKVVPSPVTTYVAFQDLGQKSSDLLTGSFNVGNVWVSAKTKTKSGVEFSSLCETDVESVTTRGGLETKYRDDRHGVAFSENWATNNSLETRMEICLLYTSPRPRAS